MFTGLIEAKSQLKGRSPLASGQRLTFSHSFSDIALGESIAVSGACLTVVSFDDQAFSVDVSTETLSLTTLGDLNLDDEVNLERALAAGARLGGHLVTGHVDGVGTIAGLAPEGDMTRVIVRLPVNLARYVARKGSLTIEGVSLTVNDVRADASSTHGEAGETPYDFAHLLIIPHTRRETTLGSLAVGKRVNLEIDLVARYVERLLSARTPSSL